MGFVSGRLERGGLLKFRVSLKGTLTKLVETKWLMRGTNLLPFGLVLCPLLQIPFLLNGLFKSIKRIRVDVESIQKQHAVNAFQITPNLKLKLKSFLEQTHAYTLAVVLWD